MVALSLPPEVEAVFNQFRTAEVSTLAQDGTPIAWPMVVVYRPAEMRFVTASSVGLAGKIYNIRRNSHVSLLYSEPKASGLTDPPAVLVQGDAEAPDEITSARGLEDYWRAVFQRQPTSRSMSNGTIARYMVDWYYMRVRILITPRRILWWPRGDFTQAAQEVEVSRVG